MKADEFEFWQVEKSIGLEANILKAMECYEHKSGQHADLVVLHPAELVEFDCVGFSILRMKCVLPGTLWVGLSKIETNGQDRIY